MCSGERIPGRWQDGQLYALLALTFRQRWLELLEGHQDEATLIGSGENPKLTAGEKYVLFTTKTEPDQVNRSPGSEEQAPEEEIVVGV